MIVCKSRCADTYMMSKPGINCVGQQDFVILHSQIFSHRDTGDTRDFSVSLWLCGQICIMAGTAMPRSHRGTGVSPVNDWAV
ncbi:MAG: hypothetical protein DMG09_16150 [Acidobacteria bacterium]|nr:MAG: hypothetical protein DMG09_16150 [Acidobacteriota bacterium]